MAEYNSNHSLNALLGKTIQELHIQDNGLCFVTEEEIFYFDLEGDCCSETWLYQVQGLSCLLGGKVLGIVSLEKRDDPDDGLGRKEVDTVYVDGIHTDRGMCTITYRNSSNGYYGGWIAKGKPWALTEKKLTEDWIYTKNCWKE